MRKSRKKEIIIAIVVLLAIICTIVVVNLLNKKKVELTEIAQEDIKYYLIRDGQNYGVIDREGNIIIEPQYFLIDIPNPTIDKFVCYLSKGGSKVVNASNEEVLTEYNNIQAISINQITSNVPFEKTVLRYEENGVYGLIDFSGKKITNAIYEDITNLEFKEGYLKVKKNGLTGIIDINGRKILDCEYDDIIADGYYDSETNYSNAGFVLRIKTDEGYRFGYANTDGKVILQTIYNEINRITDINNKDGVYIIPAYNGRYGLVKNGKQIIENEYQNVEYNPLNKVVIITKGQANGVSSLDGKTIVPIDYDSISIGGSYINAVKGDKKIIFDVEGKTIDTKNLSYTKINDNYAIIIDENNNYNVVDSDNNELFKNKYIYIEHYFDNYFIVSQGSKTGIVDSNENIIVPVEYSSIQKIKDTNLLMAIASDNNRIDIINKYLKVTKGIENASIEKNKKYVKVFSENDFMYVDMDGNKTEYIDIVPTNTLFAKKSNGKWGFVDSKGNNVIDYKYENVTEQNGNYVGVKLNGKWGVLDIKGNEVVEPKYELSQNNPSFLNKYYKVTTGMDVAMYCAN